MKKSIQVVMTLMIFLAITAVIAVSCKKDKDEEVVKPNPTISFKKDAGYTYASLVTHYGDSIKIGVIGKSNGTDNIKKFRLTANGQTMLDTAINIAEYNADFIITKGLVDKESWVFTVTDANGKSATDSIVITRTKEINTYTSVIIGAQTNATIGGFYGTSNNTIYTMDDAFNNQSLIDILCFYEDNSNKTALASPGANITGIFTGAHAPENWAIKNTTLYVKTSLTAADFDAVTNDDAIIPTYVAANAFRKAKNLVIGDVYCFLTQRGNMGLLKVTAVTPNADGSAEFAVKIQK
jgi:hypothetical protein